MLDGLLLSKSQRDSLERATATFEKNVDRLGSYLEGRGIERQAALSARLGYVSEPLPGLERFVGMMAVPYLALSGPVAIKFRRLEGEGPKYDAPSGQHARLYNVTAVTLPGDAVAVCEGELDALVCTSVVGVPAVGTPGTTWLDHWPRCLADFARVIVVADNDEKDDGSNPGLKHAKSVAKSVPNAQIVTPPLGLDLGEWVLRDGADAVRNALIGV